MRTYEEDKKQILEFLKESKMNVYDLARISRDLCSCGKCRFFTQHYTKDGQPVDFGHCSRNSIPKGKRLNDSSCGYWQYGGE